MKSTFLPISIVVLGKNWDYLRLVTHTLLHVALETGPHDWQLTTTTEHTGVKSRKGSVLDNHRPCMFTLLGLIEIVHLTCFCCSVAKSSSTATSSTVAFQAPLPSTISWSLLRFMLSQWCYLTILSSAASFSFCLQSFPLRDFSIERSLPLKT